MKLYANHTLQFVAVGTIGTTVLPATSVFDKKLLPASCFDDFDKMGSVREATAEDEARFAEALRRSGGNALPGARFGKPKAAESNGDLENAKQAVANAEQVVIGAKRDHDVKVATLGALADKGDQVKPEEKKAAEDAVTTAAKAIDAAEKALKKAQEKLAKLTSDDLV